MVASKQPAYFDPDQPPPGCEPAPLGWFCPTPKRRKKAKARRAPPKRKTFNPRRE